MLFMAYFINEKKYSLFLVIVLGSIALLSIPLISSHFLHDEHLLHIAVHEAGFVLAAFLTTMAVISFLKTRITRMLFSATAFCVLTLGQGWYMYEKMDDHVWIDMASSTEILDLCILIMTVLFAFGVFYKHNP